MATFQSALRSITRRIFKSENHKAARRQRRRSAFLQVEGLEDRRMLATFYVDDSFLITSDTDPSGLSPGDTVTWQAGSGSAHSPSTVSGLTFGTNAFTSIQAAVDAAASTAEENDLILVGSGTFVGRVTVNTSVTLQGNQVGVDAQSRTSAAESIVVGDLGATAFYVTANNVTIDGFTVQGATNPNQFGFGILLGAGTSGHAVRNNIIQDNIVGIGLGSDNTTISGNLIVNNNVSGPAGGTGIYSDEFVAGGALTNVTITNNTISGNVNAGVVIGPSNSSLAASNITISSNIMNENGTAVVLINTQNSTITLNEITASTGAGINLAGGNNGIAITNNIIADGEAQGILINNTPFFPTAANANVTINNNSITGNAGAGLEVAPGAYSGTLNAEDNWWGSASGPTNPGNPGGTGQAIIGANIDFLPFLRSGVDADPDLRGFQVRADLSVAKSVSPTSVAAGDTLTYTLVVRNNSTTTAARNVTVTDTLPDDVTIVSIQAPGGWTTSTGGDPVIVSATTPSLGAGAQATFTYIVRVDEDVEPGTELTNSVTVSSSTDDANLGNNATTTTTVVVEDAIELVCEITTANLPGASRSATIQDDADTDGRVLIVTGTSGNDNISVDRLNGNRIRVRMSGFERVFNQNVDAQAFDRIVVFGQSGNDRITVGTSVGISATLLGGSGNDTLIGSSAADELDGGAGNDTLNGGAGNDVLCGGDGNDTINGGAGDDVLGGDEGNDRLRGDAGNDLLIGNEGNDNLDGGAGNDRLFGQEGNDSLFGQAGNDILVGGNGNDRLNGGAGLDILIGGRGSDTLNGGGGDDVLVGGATSLDEDIRGLDEVLAAWLSGTPNRHDTIRDLFGEIEDDNSSDTLSGEGGEDWFLTGSKDSIRDRSRTELVN